MGVDFEFPSASLHEMRFYAYAYFDALTKDLLMQKIFWYFVQSRFRYTRSRGALRELGRRPRGSLKLLHLVPPSGGATDRAQAEPAGRQQRRSGYREADEPGRRRPGNAAGGVPCWIWWFGATGWSPRTASAPTTSRSRASRIVAVAAPGTLTGDVARTIDATGKIVVPGGIDPHTHCHWPVPFPGGATHPRAPAPSRSAGPPSSAAPPP